MSLAIFFLPAAIVLLSAATSLLTWRVSQLHNKIWLMQHEVKEHWHVIAQIELRLRGEETKEIEA